MLTNICYKYFQIMLILKTLALIKNYIYLNISILYYITTLYYTMNIYLIGLIVIGAFALFIGIPTLMRSCCDDCSRDNNKYTEI